MKDISFEVKVHATSDRKKLKKGMKLYEYGVINIRSPELKAYVGKIVKIKVSVKEKNNKKK